MKTVTGSVVSSKPISLSKAASTLSSFLSAKNGASQALCAYLRRASASFNELKQLHKELKPARSDRKHRHHRSEASNDLESAVDNPYRSEDDGEKKNSSVSESKSGKRRRQNRDRTEDEQHGKTSMASSGNGNFEDAVVEDGKRKGGGLKAEIEEDRPNGRVEMDVELNDRDKSGVVAVEKKRKKHKMKSEDACGKIEDDERNAGGAQSYGKSGINDNNGETKATAGDFVENNVARGKDRKKHENKKSLEQSTNKDNDDGPDLVELSTKKKKKEKEKREGDAADDLQNNSGAMVKEEIPVSDSKELKRKERKKRKNRDLEEGGGGDGGSEEQQGTKSRKGNS